MSHPDLERVAVAVQACPAVAGLHGGRDDTIATALPQGRLLGIAVHGDDLVIGVVGRYPAAVAEIAAQVRAAAAEHAHGYRVIVSVEDLHVPSDDDRYGPTTLATGPHVLADPPRPPPVGGPDVVEPDP